MYRNLYLTSLFLLLNSLIHAQTDNIENVKMINDHLFLDIYANNWLNTPKNIEINPGSVSAQVNWYLVLLGRHSCVSLNIGYGISTHSIKSNTLFLPDINRNTIFNTNILDSTNYKINKFSSVFFEIPLEIRFRTRPSIKNRNFTFSLGFKGGYLVQSFHKYYGNDYRFPGSKEEVKYKDYMVKNILKYRYGAYTRIGYGRVFFYGFYCLSTLFESGKGPELYPVNFGIGFNLYRSKTY